MADETVRAAFVEEMSDVLMYYVDTLLRYRITPEELATAYRDKHEHNLSRAYHEENALFLNGDKQP